MWLAINDLMKSKNLEIVGFAGASVGALNAALFSCCSPSEAEEIWRHIHWSTVLSAGFDNNAEKKQRIVSDYFLVEKD